MRRNATQTKVSSKVSSTVQVRCLCHIMRQAESSRDNGQATEKLLSPRRVRVLFVAHVKTSADRSDRRSAADVGQELTIFSHAGTVEAGRVTPCVHSVDILVIDH